MCCSVTLFFPNLSAQRKRWSISYVHYHIGSGVAGQLFRRTGFWRALAGPRCPCGSGQAASTAVELEVVAVLSSLVLQVVVAVLRSIALQVIVALLHLEVPVLRQYSPRVVVEGRPVHSPA